LFTTLRGFCSPHDNDPALCLPFQEEFLPHSLFPIGGADPGTRVPTTQLSLCHCPTPQHTDVRSGASPAKAPLPWTVGRLTGLSPRSWTRVTLEDAAPTSVRLLNAAAAIRRSGDRGTGVANPGLARVTNGGVAEPQAHLCAAGTAAPSCHLDSEPPHLFLSQLDTPQRSQNGRHGENTRSSTLSFGLPWKR
jgi:hypothetical protein